MSTLYLPDGVRTAVWRLVKAQLRTDPVLSREFITQVFFEGPADRKATTSLDEYGTDVAVRYLASLGRMVWADERSMEGDLIVSYEVFVRSLDDEDVFNVQEAIESALYPADNHAFEQSLIDAGGDFGGATTGQARFSQPTSQALAGAGRDGVFRPTGQFVIEVKRGFPA
jgi:hypothetical protein